MPSWDINGDTFPKGLPYKIPKGSTLNEAKMNPEYKLEMQLCPHKFTHPDLRPRLGLLDTSLDFKGIGGSSHLSS